jgi:Secretion system C-terminal sorting domain
MKTTLFLVSILLLVFNVNAQLISGNGFMKSEFLEVGVAPNGTIGASVPAPATFKGIDPIGVSPNVKRLEPGPGVALYDYDFIASGSPIEMWFIKSSGKSGTADFHEYKGFFGDLDGGAITHFWSRECTWEGSMDSLLIKQNVTIHDLGLTVMFKIQLKNVSTARKEDISYGRIVDPDIYGTYTRMKIVKQTPNAENESYVTSRGDDPSYIFGIRSNDIRAKVYYYTVDLLPKYGVDSISKEIGLDPAFIAIHEGDTLYNDVSMGIAFDLGSIEAGDSTEFTFLYEFAERGDCYRRFAYGEEIYQSGDTITTCPEVQSIGLKHVGFKPYKWAFSPFVVDTSFGTVKVIPKEIVTISAISSGDNLCPDDTFKITIQPYPVVKPVVITAADLLYIDSSNHFSFAWYKVGSPFQLSSYASCKARTAGNYFVRVKDLNGCTQYSDTVYVDEASLSINSVGGIEEIDIVPNPSRGELTILSEHLYNISVSDISGRQLLQLSNKNKLDISNFSPGIYLISLSDNAGLIKARKKISKLD